MKVVVIIPTYNEKENIVRTVSALQVVFKTVKNHEMHILITDANSPDGTANIVRGLMKQSSNIHLVVEKEKRGLGAAYKDAMDYAFNTMKSGAIITFDADLSHDSKKIPKIIKYLERGEHYICGTRYRKGGGIPPQWGIHRKILSFCGNLYARILYLGSGLSDFTSGFKALDKEIYDTIKDKIGVHGGYTFAISTNLEPIRSGYKAIEVPYHFVDRTLGKSKMGPEYFSKAFVFITQSRITDFVMSRLGKVFIAGSFGAFFQLLSYGLLFFPIIESANLFNLPVNVLFFGLLIHPQFLLSQLFAIEVGVTSAFAINNVWAFGDKKLSGVKFLRGLLKTHLVITAAILIQLAIGQLLAVMFGIGLFRNYIYQSIGILVGLAWNFHFYKKIIWRTRK